MKDTPFERRQHESTAKHQNNLKRFLRDIQNDHERSEREKQKAKDEVERLNKLTGTGIAQATAPSTAPTIRKPASRPLTADDQKRQWTQLAEMGIQVPDTYRGELAQASNWSVVSKPKGDLAPKEESLSKGVRKRTLEEADEDEQEIVQPQRKVWGKSTRSYPGHDNTDLDALLSGQLPLKKGQAEIKAERPDAVPNEQTKTSNTPTADAANTANEAAGDTSVTEGTIATTKDETKDTVPLVKQESGDDGGQATVNSVISIPVFKKRKNKATANAVT